MYLNMGSFVYLSMYFGSLQIKIYYYIIIINPWRMAYKMRWMIKECTEIN